MSGKLPNGWTQVRLSDILLTVEAGKSFTCEPRQAAPDEWGIIKVSAMTWGTFNADENKAVPTSRKIDPRYEIRPGDILVSRANTEAYVGAPVLVGQCRPQLLLSDKSLRLVPGKGIDRQWLVHALASPTVRGQISAKSTGAQESMRNISQSALNDIEIPLPPLAEQRRIVEALEDHLSRLDAASTYVARARRATTSFDNAQQRDLLRPWLSATRRLRTLLASPLINGRSVPTDDDGFPVLRLTAIKRGALDLSARKGGAWNQEAAAPFLVEQGDFMVSRGSGSLRLVGRGALAVEVPDLVAFPDTMIRVRPDQNKIDAQFLAFVWDSPQVRGQVEASARTTAGIYKINQAILEGLEIPVPPLDEQERIVESAKEQLAGVDRLVSAIETAHRRAGHLRRALLAEAFSGKLVPQDPVDEPASELLARIEAEHASLVKGKAKPVRLARTTATKASLPRKTTTVPAGIQEELPL